MQGCIVLTIESTGHVQGEGHPMDRQMDHLYRRLKALEEGRAAAVVR